MNLRVGFAGAIWVACCLLPARDLPTHHYDLRHIVWRISFDEAHRTIAGDVTNVLTPTEKSVSEIFLHCARLAVSSVTVNGRPAKYRMQGDRLWVTFPKPMRLGETVSVRTIYTGSPENGLYFVSPEAAYPAKTGMVYTQGEAEDNRFWLPTYDLPDDKATWEGYIEAPQGYMTLSNGKLVGVERHGKNRIFHWKSEQPNSTYLIAFVAGRYSETTKKAGGVPVSYLTPPGLEREGAAAFGKTPEMLGVLSKLLGTPYPYPKYSQAAVGDFVVGGMENANAATLTIRTLHPPESEPVDDSSSIVVHELAHQWFGDLVTCRSWQHLWLHEGFATLLPALWIRETRGTDEYELERYSTYIGAVAAASAPPSFVNAPTDSSTISRALGSPYTGGAARLFMLMDLVGEDRFWRGVREFLKDHRFDLVTTEDFFGSMSKSTGMDLSAFMAQWFYGTGVPTIQASMEGEELVVRQRRPYFKLDLPVWILSGNDWTKQEVHLAGAEARLPLGELADNPILVDPEFRTLAQVSVKLPMDADQIRAVYDHAPNAAEKAFLIDTTFSKLADDELGDLVDSEKSPLLLARMITRLRPSESSTERLVRLLGHEDRRVAYIAASTLGRMPPDKDAIGPLMQMYRSDPNYELQQAALGSLLALTGDDDLADEAWGMDSFNDSLRVRVLSWWAKANPSKGRERALGVLAGSSTQALRLTAIEALGSLGDRSGDRKVYSVLCDVLKGTGFRDRQAAIRALGAYGDARAIPVIEPLASQHFLAPAVEATIAQIKHRRG